MVKKRLFDIISGKKTTLDCSSVKSAINDLSKYFLETKNASVFLVKSHTVWTRLDGHKYKELARLEFWDINNNTFDNNLGSELVWKTLCGIDGFERGGVSGEFRSSDAMPAIKKGKVFFSIKRRASNSFIYVGSTSRLKRGINLHSWVDTTW